MAEPKVLLLDIETLPNTVLSWGLKVDGWLPHDNIVDEKHIACAAWKWLDEPEVFAERAIIGAEKPDAPVLDRLHDAFEEATAVVAHNGDFFDVPWLYARWIVLGYAPAKPLIQIDTRKIAKHRFYFNSNRLDYLGRHLGLGGKIKTDFDLWKRVRVGNVEAMNEMVTYNQEDVRLLERVFHRMAPYTTAKLNRALFVEDQDTADRTCPSCGKQSLRAEGYSYTRVGKRRNYVCGNRVGRKVVEGSGCGHWCYRKVEANERPGPSTPR